MPAVLHFPWTKAGSVNMKKFRLIIPIICQKHNIHQCQILQILYEYLPPVPETVLHTQKSQTAT